MTRSPLLPVSEALQRLLALGHSTDRVELPLREAAGRWAASDIGALRTQPDADLSAMDGYAIRFADMPGPWRVVAKARPGIAMIGR